MIHSMLHSTAQAALEQNVAFTEARHGVLAGNIANFDTPGYRVRDLPPELFHERLQAAIESEQSGSDDLRSANRVELKIDEVAESMRGILFHDDSNGSLEHQVAELSKNQLRHNTAIAVMSHQFRLLEAAISEQA